MLPLPQYDFLPTGTHDEESRENFCRGLAVKLAADIRPPLKTLFETEIKPAFEAEHGREPNFREIAKAMRKQTKTKIWYRLRTDNQDRMYSVTGDMISRQAKTLTDRALSVFGTTGSLTLDPTLEMPRYLTEVDIHRKPGGYHYEMFPGDVSPGAQYDRTIALHNMGSQGIHNDDPARSIATWIKETYPDIKPQRILDLGCTIGNNLSIGRFAMIGMGALVTKSIPDFHLALGHPARSVGVVCRCGPVVHHFGENEGAHDVTCTHCGRQYAIATDREVTEIE